MSENERDFHDLAKDILSPHGPHEFGEVFVHSMIETIEYALGTVSNTASYLRLWALSLAHGQLAKVFFDYTISATINMTMGYVGCFLAWYLFFAITFSVLMMMDLLEASLHCLRLHWVEFNNKFFKGQGYAFRPFSIERVMQAN
jgi:V-type H+-transporting ATPase subunit a